MGALIAYELACRLRDRGGPAPVHVFVSGRGAPGLPPIEPPARDLPDGEFLERLRRYGGTPEDVLGQPELMELLLPVLRADFTLIETWTDPGHAPLDVPLCVLGGLADASVDPDQLEGWRARTRGAFTLKMLPGDHFFIQSAETTLLRILAEALTPSSADPRTRRDTGGYFP
jgi:medium-chain acyl-[acyl-carrier-protein] hydrolase